MQSNPISLVIVAIIHGRENEPCGWGSLLLNLLFVASEKDNLESTKQTHDHLTHNSTMQKKGGGMKLEGPIVSSIHRAALTDSPAVSKADTESHRDKTVKGERGRGDWRTQDIY